MQFLSNWTINVSQIPTYVEFNQDFVESIDYELANIILEEKDESIAPESMKYFSNLVACIDKSRNELKVKYSPRKGGLGRRYPDCPNATYPDGRPDPKFGKYYSGLITVSRKIKNTIFYYQNWRDYDQVKGHPTILLELGKRNHVPLPAFEDYLRPGRFDEICKVLIEFYSADPDNLLTRKDIKWLFNKTIYGGGFKEWINDIKNGQKRDVHGKPSFTHNPKLVQNIDIKHSIYTAFHKDTKTIINLVYQNNPELVNLVCSDLPDTNENLWSRKNRLMSYVCGIIENEITFQAYKYITNNGICKKRYLSWGYDGFTIPPPTSPDFDEELFLTNMNAYVCEKTGFQTVSFIRKEFEESDILFECIEKRKRIMPTTVETRKRKYAEELNVYKISAAEVVDPFAASKVIYKTLQHSLRLCNESWYMLQKNQLWKSQKEAGFFIVEEMHKYLDQGRNHLNHMMNNTDGDEKENYIKELKKWIGFYQLVSSNSYVSGITKFLRSLLADDRFAESLNALKGKLAFQNGIMDLETKTFREGIRYDDYITETIPFNYRPVENTDFVRSKLKLILNNNDEQLEYHLSVFGFSFVGMPDLMKSVFFHIDKTKGGRGDNGKSFFFSILNELMPNYVYKSKSTFLDKNNNKNHKQIAHIKGKRIVYLEEMPKTQAMNHSLFKEIGDGVSIENEVMVMVSQLKTKLCTGRARRLKSNACYMRFRTIFRISMRKRKLATIDTVRFHTTVISTEQKRVWKRTSISWNLLQTSR